MIHKYRERLVRKLLVEDTMNQESARMRTKLPTGVDDIIHEELKLKLDEESFPYSDPFDDLFELYTKYQRIIL